MNNTFGHIRKTSTAGVSWGVEDINNKWRLMISPQHNYAYLVKFFVISYCRARKRSVIEKVVCVTSFLLYYIEFLIEKVKIMNLCIAIFVAVAWFELSANLSKLHIWS